MNCFLLYFSLQTYLFHASRGVQFNPAIVEEREVNSSTPNLQDVKVEVKEENDATETAGEEYDGDPSDPKTVVEGKPAFSNGEIEENVKGENETNYENEELEDFIVKGELVDEIGAGAQDILYERRILAGKKFMQKGRCILTYAGKKKPHKCEECGKFFSRNYNLSQHMLIHTGKKPHNCEKCGKSFTAKSHLSQHILAHKGEKIHNCKECGKSFILRGHLTKHTLLHTGEKPHVCEKCGKSFSQKSHLSQHTFIHTGEKPHKCDKCGKSFSNKSNLYRHMPLHVRETNPINCDK